MKQHINCSVENTILDEAKNFGLKNISAFIETQLNLFIKDARARAYEREHGVPQNMYCSCGASYSSILPRCPQCNNSKVFATTSAEAKIKTMRL